MQSRTVSNMSELEKNDVIEVDVVGEGADGEGVARYEGKAIFIRGALINERVRAKIILVKPKFNIAILEKVLVPSPFRTENTCPVYPRCGGCDLRHLSYEGQLEFKRRMVRDTLRKVGGIDIQPLPTVASPLKDRYRNKISLPVRENGGETHIGLFAKNSHRIIETDDCLLQYAWTKPLIAALRSFLDEHGLTGYNEGTREGDVRHIVAREAGGRLYVTLVTTHPMRIDGFYPMLEKIHPDVQLWLNVNRRDDNVILGNDWKHVRGSTDPVCVDGLKTDIHPAGFFQVNDDVRTALYDYVASLVHGAAVVEAYSGAGLLSAKLAKKAKRVYGIEINPQSSASAVKLVQDNGIDNFTPVCGDVGKELGGVLRTLKQETGEDTFIVLDPPRTGISREAADTLLGSGADNIVYVSCNPATLARDLKILSTAYDVQSVQPFDMFPNTANVETVVRLVRKA